MGGLRKSRKLIAYILPISAEDLADINHRVQLLPAVFERLFDFGKLDRGRVSTVRESYRRTGADRGSRQQFSAPGQIIGHYADACNVISDRQRASLFERYIREGRVE